MDSLQKHLLDECMGSVFIAVTVCSSSQAIVVVPLSYWVLAMRFVHAQIAGSRLLEECSLARMRQA